MYLSQLSLQLNSPGVRQAMRNGQDMHRTLMKAFDSVREQADVLYRLMKTDRQIMLYVQSMAKPEWERIQSSGFICMKMQDISALSDKLQKDTILHFSLLACPTKKIKGDEKNSKRVLIRTGEGRLEWLKRQGEKYGFSVLEAHEAMGDEVLFCVKESGSFHLSGVPFEGVLRITDADRFWYGFQHGIGAEKAYGFGMLMISRV